MAIALTEINQPRINNEIRQLGQFIQQLRSAPLRAFSTRTAAAVADLSGLDAVTIARYDVGKILWPARYEPKTSEPTHDLKFQARDNTWWGIAETHITPGMCGAPTTYTADASEAVQRMVNAVRGSYNPVSGQFAMIGDLGARMWTVETSIDCTGVRQAGLTLVNGGLYGKCTARAILDLSGTQGVRCDWSFHGDETNKCLCAVLLCKAVGLFGSVGLHDLEEVEIKGVYQGAALINYGAEVVRYPRRPVWNNLKSTGRATIIITGESDYLVKWMGAGTGAGGSRVVSDYRTLESGKLSCINHLFTTFDIRRGSSWGALPIAAISKASPGVVTLSSATTKIDDGDATYFTDIAGMAELNTKTYFLKQLTSTTYELYTDGALTTPLDTTGFGTFTGGNLWAATGPALILAGGAKDIGDGHGYGVTYGGDVLIIDAQYGTNEINNVRLTFQHEAKPQRSIRYVAPDDISGVPQSVNHHDHHFSFLNANQDWSTSVIGGQRVSGTGSIVLEGLHLNIPKWSAAPSTGVFAGASDSYFTLRQAVIRVPDAAAFDVTGFAGFTGKVMDYANDNVTTYGEAKFSTITDGTQAEVLRLDFDSPTTANSDQAYVGIYMSDDAGDQIETARITSVITDVTAGSVDSELRFGVKVGGALAVPVRIAPNLLAPNVNDNSALGSTALQWSDLFLASGAVINFNNSDVTITHGADALTIAGGTLITAAGTATVAPIVMQSGTNLTTPAAGAIEYDGNIFYGTHAADKRGVVPLHQIASLNAGRTLTSTTAQQAIFAAGYDALTVVAGTTYRFSALIHLSGMSATSGNFTFSLLGAGTAVINSAKWVAHGLDSTTPTTAAAGGSSLGSSATGAGNIVTAGTGTAVAVYLDGIFRVNPSGGGTIIPSVGLTTAAAATAETNTFFELWPVGPHTLTSVGHWA